MALRTAIGSSISRSARSRFADGFLLLIAYLVVATTAFGGFYDRWKFRDGDPTFSFVTMISGTAERPYVYRQFLPAVVNAADAVLPDRLKTTLIAALYTKTGDLKSGIKSAEARDRRYVLRYHFLYYGTFLALLASLFIMRELCLVSGFDRMASAVAPCLLVLLIPVLQSTGGFFYDFTELFFLSSALLFVLKGRFLALMPWTAAATSNKESFLFFALSLYPFVRLHLPPRKTIAIVGTLVAISGAVYLLIRHSYAGNPGLTNHNYAIENFYFYLNPRSLFRTEITYGIRTFAGYSIVTVTLISLICARAWGGVSAAARHHVIMAASINFPLLFLFCYPGEMRNLSLLYMGFLLLLAQNLSDFGKRAHGRA